MAASSRSPGTGGAVVAVIDFSELSGGKKSSPLNPLSLQLRKGILERLDAAARDGSVAGVVLTGGGGGGGTTTGNFSAGADLSELSSLVGSIGSASGPDSSLSSSLASGGGGPTLLDVVAAIENCPKPVVAAISGACLGGGLEVALACHHRVAVASPATKLGLPEVHVGVIPGAGGTQRLPRLIGLQPALQMILTGKPVDAKKAMKLGLVDDVVVVVEAGKDNTQLLEVAAKWARWAEAMPSLDEVRLSRRRVPVTPPEAHVVLHVASLSLPKPEAGGEGVHAALEAIRAACALPSFENGMAVESRLFLKVLTSQQGRARRHAFFAVRKAQKPVLPPAQLGSSSVRDHPLLQRNHSRKQAVEVAVIGAGTMGGGIALCLLQAGFTVWLVDVSQEALSRGLKLLRGTVESNVKRGRMSPKAAETVMKSCLKSTTRLEDLGRCELVVEAVVENLKIKQKVFGTLSRVCRPTTLLLSNTSTLDLDQIFKAVSTSNPGRVAGWHFFSPAHVMQLVEIVRGSDTSQETVAVLQALTKRIRKIGVVVGNCDGFCGNRMLKPYSAETVLLLTEDGCSVDQVDAAFLEFGMALGPFQMSDLAGNDIGYNVRRERGWVRSDDSGAVPPKRPTRYTELADVMVSRLGRNGQKVGKGWYDYNPAVGKGRKGLPSKEMDDLIRSYTTPGITSGQTMSGPDIVERVFYPLVNEGFKILEEGIARSPDDVDVVYLHGYGFPAWRGGPMFWADHEVTLPRLLAKLQDFSLRYPDTEHYRPSRLLEECVRLGVTSGEYYKRGLHEKSDRNLLSKL